MDGGRNVIEHRKVSIPLILKTKMQTRENHEHQKLKSLEAALIQSLVGDLTGGHCPKHTINKELHKISGNPNRSALAIPAQSRSVAQCLSSMCDAPSSISSITHHTHIHLYSSREGWTQWLMPAIPATQEVEIRRIVVLGQPRQKVSETPSQQTGQVWLFIICKNPGGYIEGWWSQATWVESKTLSKK
jgi:hypothetical protein